MPERAPAIFQLQTICSMENTAALGPIRDALNQAGVYVNDIRHLSNKATVLQVMLRKERWTDLLDALSNSGLSLDPPSAAYPDSLKPDKDGDIFGTIQVLYAQSGPDVQDVVPSVPG